MELAASQLPNYSSCEVTLGKETLTLLCRLSILIVFPQNKPNPKGLYLGRGNLQCSCLDCQWWCRTGTFLPSSRTSAPPAPTSPHWTLQMGTQGFLSQDSVDFDVLSHTNQDWWLGFSTEITDVIYTITGWVWVFSTGMTNIGELKGVCRQQSCSENVFL